jgi:hypothetical protein
MVAEFPSPGGSKMNSIALWMRRSGWMLAVVIVGVLLDLTYLYFTRTRGGLGFKFNIRPGIDAE